MLRAIKEIQPRWIVGENVYGLVNWSGGLVFHEVQADLEVEGYEVFPYLLPAVSVNAPHRRDRIWFVAHSENNGWNGREYKQREGVKINQRDFCKHKTEGWNEIRPEFERYSQNGDVADTEFIRLEHSTKSRQIRGEKENAIEEGGQSSLSTKTDGNGYKSNWNNFPTVSPVRNGNDGISDRLDSITFPKWRNESIKAGGNAIVPQVVLQIFKAIEQYERISASDKSS